MTKGKSTDAKAGDKLDLDVKSVAARLRAAFADEHHVHGCPVGKGARRWSGAPRLQLVGSRCRRCRVDNWLACLFVAALVSPDFMTMARKMMDGFKAMGPPESLSRPEQEIWTYAGRRITDVFEMHVSAAELLGWLPAAAGRKPEDLIRAVAQDLHHEMGWKPLEIARLLYGHEDERKNLAWQGLPVDERQAQHAKRARQFIAGRRRKRGVPSSSLKARSSKAHGEGT